MLDVAVDAAKAGGDLAYRYFKTHPKVTYKPDNSPVTKADIEVEKLIRKIITKNFPDHDIHGEELPDKTVKSKYQWIIDPIDGTRYYSSGLDYWSTLLAVLENGKPIIGISYYPATKEFFVAEKDKGTFLNDKKMRVSKIKSLEQAFFAHGSIQRLSKMGKLPGLISLYDKTLGHSGFGWSLSLNLLFKGKVETALETGNIHDFAAPALLTQEAGGKFSDLSGKPSLTSGVLLVSNGLLHNQVLKILNGLSPTRL